MSEDRHIYIEQPDKFKGELTLNMGDKGTKDCPVSIRFKPEPVNLVHHTKEPIDVNMHMSFDDCLKIGLCQPICAKSDYEIGLKLFNRDVGAITVRGLTRLHNCDEIPDLECTGFDELPPKRQLQEDEEFEYNGFTFIPVGGTATFSPGGAYLPARNKLWVRAGLRIELPQPSDRARIGVCNYVSSEVIFKVYVGALAVDQFTEHIADEYKKVSISRPAMTAVEVWCVGESRTAIVEVCYDSAQAGRTPAEGDEQLLTNVKRRRPV